jgi:hypothetical protein
MYVVGSTYMNLMLFSFLSSPYMLIPIGVVLAGIVFLLLSLQKKQNVIDHPVITNIDINVADFDATSYHQTPKGVTVRSYQPVPAEALDAVDRGILHQILNASYANPTWTNFARYRDYEVFLIDPQGYTEIDDPGAPALFVRALQPASTTQTYTIKSAGTCIGVGGSILGQFDDTRYPAIVVCHQATPDPAHPEQLPWSHLAFLEEAVRNESEHIREWTNDHAVFTQFAIAGDVHPHWPIDPPADWVPPIDPESTV